MGFSFSPSSAAPVVERQEPEVAAWYVVYAHARAEQIAARHLERQGFSIFLPYRIRTVRHARRVTVAKDAYFPRYLFISLQLDRDQWHCVNSTVGVIHLLSSCDRPLAMRRGLVEALMLGTGPDGVLRPSEVLKPGQSVKVSCGAFVDQIGTLDYVSSSGSARGLLTMTDRKVPVNVSREMSQRCP